MALIFFLVSSLATNLYASGCGLAFELIAGHVINHERVRNTFPRRNEHRPGKERVPTTEEQLLIDAHLSHLNELLKVSGLHAPKGVKVLITDSNGYFDRESNTVYTHLSFDPVQKKRVLDLETLSHEYGHAIFHANAPDIAEKSPHFDEFFAELFSCLGDRFSYVKELDPVSWRQTESHEFLAPTLCYLGKNHLQRLPSDRERGIFLRTAMSVIRGKAADPQLARSPPGKVNVALIQGFDLALQSSSSRK